MENIWRREIFGPWRKRKTEKEKEEKFPEKENARMCDKHIDRLCKDRARILESQQ